jgi:hypothetical protein
MNPSVTVAWLTFLSACMIVVPSTTTLVVAYWARQAAKEKQQRDEAAAKLAEHKLEDVANAAKQVAVEAKQVAVRVAEVAKVAADGADRADRKADENLAITKDVHTLVNSQMGQQLMLFAITARTLANLTNNPAHIKTADEADAKLAEHQARQATVDERHAN